MHPITDNKTTMPITRRMEIDMRIQVCLILWMNFDYKEIGGKDAFPANLKHQYRVSHYGENDCIASNKKNRDCYRYPCLSHLTDEL